MDISVHTVHHVNMDYTPAGIFERCMATTIDFMVMFVLIAVLAMLAGFFSWEDEFSWISMLVITPVLFYHLISEVCLNGKSLGKMAMNIQVVKLNGKKLTFWDCLLRWIFRLVDITITSGSLALITIAFTRCHQRLGDLAANTIVIKHQQKITLSQLQQYHTSDNYTVVYPQAIMLTDKDASLIKEVLEAVYKSNSYFLLEPLAHRIRQTTGIEDSKINYLDFIETILRDYTHLTKQ